jgi:hypothetical protein
MTPIIVDPPVAPVGAVVDYQRVARGSLESITASFPAAPAPNTATVTLTRDDGTIIVAATAATPGTGGAFSYPLLAAHTATLDILTAAWTSSVGTVTTIVEIVGGFLFSVAEARAVKPLDQTTYTTAMITATRTLVEQALEDACGVAFVPRYKRETVTGTGSTRMVLSQPRVTAVRSITADGAAITYVATGASNASGVIYYPSGFARDTAYTVSYEHGEPSPPLPAKQAALALAKKFLLSGPVDDRTTTMSTEDGTYILSTPGLRGAIWGVPVADSFAAQYSQRACIV